MPEAMSPYMKNTQQHQSVELRQYVLVDQVDSHRALDHVAWLQITRLIIINPLKFFNFSQALVVMFKTSTLSLGQGKSIAIFGGDHLVWIVSKTHSPWR